ncbi:hypothetical protein MMC29_001285, partial [Sticta canariensis]|nr:hypothetical protein [Sticta canariensis]
RYGDILTPPAQAPGLANGTHPPWQNMPGSAANGLRMNGDIDVESVPVLTRLMASQHSAELANDQLRQFQGGLATSL